MAYAIVSCKKYHQRGLKIMDFGPETTTKKQIQEVIAKFPGFECRVCGPCSHVEMNWDDYWTVHTVGEDVNAITRQAWSMVDAAPLKYTSGGLPTKPEPDPPTILMTPEERNAQLEGPVD